MTPRQRAQRLIDLYALRAKLNGEIFALEATMENESRAVARARKAANEAGLRIGRQPLALCGTDSGYHHHRRQLNETPCDACKLAHAAAEKLRKQRRREQDTEMAEAS